MKYFGRMTIEVIKGHPYLMFEKPSDVPKLYGLARRKYKIKTRRKRIVKKYFNKLINEALRSAMDDYESKT